MAKSFSPAPLHWFVGVELARYRQAAGLSMAKVELLTGMAKPKIGHLESGRQLPTGEEIRRLLSAYGADPRSVVRLTALAQRSEEANWWRPWADVVPPWLSILVGLERLADRLFTFEADAIPGLLQTPDYAAAMTSQSWLVRADRVQQIVDFRMGRAARLADPDRPLWLHAVIGLRALEQAVGTREIRDAQLRHLAKLADLPTVTIQVLRPQDGYVPMTTGSFTLLNFDAVSTVGYIELLDDAVYLYDTSRLRTYEVASRELERVALDPERSLELIRTMIR